MNRQPAGIGFPLTREAVEAIKDILALKREGGDVWLFPAETGERHTGSWADEVHRHIITVGGLEGRVPGAPFDFHSVRRTFCSMMSDGAIGAELSADDRRLLMRHEVLKTTQRYDKADETKRFAAVSKIDRKTHPLPSTEAVQKNREPGPVSVTVHQSQSLRK